MQFGLCLKWREPMGAGESSLTQAGVRHGATVPSKWSWLVGSSHTHHTQAAAQQTGFLGRVPMLSNSFLWV